MHSDSANDVLRTLLPRVTTLMAVDSGRGRRGDVVPRIGRDQPLPRLSALLTETDPTVPDGGVSATAPSQRDSADAVDAPTRAEFRALQRRVQQLEALHESEDIDSVF